MFLYLTDQTVNKRISLTQKNKAKHFTQVLFLLLFTFLTYNFATGKEILYVSNSIANLRRGINLINYQFSWKIIYYKHSIVNSSRSHLSDHPQTTKLISDFTKSHDLKDSLSL